MRFGLENRREEGFISRRTAFAGRRRRPFAGGRAKEPHGVTVALQILVLSVKVRILVRLLFDHSSSALSAKA